MTSVAMAYKQLRDLLPSAKGRGKGGKVPASLQLKRELLDNKRQRWGFLTDSSRATVAQKKC